MPIPVLTSKACSRGRRPERILAVYHGEWEVLSMPFTVFTPRLFIGSAELAPLGPPPAYQSGWQLDYGVVRFSIGHRFE